MKKVPVRDICYQMLEERASGAGMNIQNYLTNLIMDDYKKNKGVYQWQRKHGNLKSH